MKTKENYQEFFELVLKDKKNIHCQNCNRLIREPSIFNCAHIFPKSIFKSIARNFLNILFLCEDCHGQYDSSWKNASKMNCWPTALHRYLMLKSKIEEDHKILDYFNKE